MSTAVFEIDLDSTKVLRSVEAVKARIAALAQSVPLSIDVKGAEQSIVALAGKIRNFGAAAAAEAQKVGTQITSAVSSAFTTVVKPRVDTSAVQAPDFAKQYSDEIAKVNVAVVGFQASIAQMKAGLTAASGAKAFSSVGISRALKKATTDSKDMRKQITENIRAIAKEATGTKIKFDNAGIVELVRNMRELQALHGQTGTKAGGEGTLFRGFAGKAPVAEIKAAIAQYRAILVELNTMLGSKLGAMGSIDAAAAGRQAGAAIKKVASAITAEGPALTSAADAVSVGLGARVATAIKTKLIAAATAVNGNLKSDFVRRFEWGQGRVALIAEAEAAFSRESIMRRVYSAIFSTAKEAGFIGYMVGRTTETLLGTFRVMVAGINAGLLFTVKNTLGRIPWVGKAITSFTAGIRLLTNSVVSVATKGLQLIFNKYMLGLLAATYSAINKIVFKVFAKIASTVYSVAKSTFARIKGILGNMFGGLFSGGGGGAGGSVFGEIGGLSLGKILGFGAIGASVAAAANLEQALNNVATITLQSGAALDVLGRKIVEVSNLSGKSAVDTANAYYDIASAGFKGAEGVLVLRNSLLLAQAGLTDVKTTAAAIARTLRSYNMAASESSQVTDIFFSIVRRGITTPAELAQQMPRLTAVAAAAGVGLKDLGASIANLTRNGQLTDQAVLGLTQIIKSIIAPTDQAKCTMRELGVEWTESAVRAKGFIAVLTAAAPKILANKGAFKEIFGDIQALKSALILASNVQDLPDDLAAMNDRAVAAQAAGIQAIGFNQQLEKMWNNILNIFRNVGQVILPYITPVISALQSFTDKLAGIANSDLLLFFQRLRGDLVKIFSNLMSVGGQIFVWIYHKWTAIKNTIIAVGIGLLNSVGKLFGVVAYKIVEYGILGLGELTIWVFKAILRPFKLLIKFVIEFWGTFIASLAGGNQTILKIFNAISWWAGLSYDNIVLVFDVLAEMVREFIRWIGWAFGMVDDKLEQSGATVGKLTMEMGENFKAGFDSWYSEKDTKNMTSGMSEDMTKALSGLGGSIMDSGKNIMDTTGNSLQAQADGIKVLITSLEKDYTAELAAGEKNKAAMTMQFISQEKMRLADIGGQLQKSDLDEAMAIRIKLHKDLGEAAKAQNIEWQKILIDQIKANEMVMIKLENEAKKKSESATLLSAKTQTSALDDMKNKALQLVEAGKKLTGSMGELNNVLDNIFGKNLERIASEYGVGKEIAASRKITRDVIEAKAAGFKEGDIDRIVKVGFMQQSDSLTKIFTAFANTSKQLNVSDLSNMGLYDEVVKLLDRASAFGMSEQSRADLLQNAIDAKTFASLDSASISDKQTSFIIQAQKQFENIDEERDLQQRFNIAQTRLSELTKTAVTKNQQLKATVEELEKNVAEIERLQEAEQSVRVAGG